MVVLGGSSDQPLESMGAFQEFPQVAQSHRYHCSTIAFDFVSRLKQLGSFQNMLLAFHHSIAFHSLWKK